MSYESLSTHLTIYIIAQVKEEQNKKKVEKPQDDDPDGEKLLKAII